MPDRMRVFLLQEPEDSCDLDVSKCSDPMVAELLCGSYRRTDLHHGKPVYVKRESSEVIRLYFWLDESAEFSGWWFGPTVGGDGVVAFHPDVAAEEPPTSGWHVPFNGPVDPNFQVSSRSVAEPQEEKLVVEDLQDRPEVSNGEAPNGDQLPEEAAPEEDSGEKAAEGKAAQETEETDVEEVGETTLEVFASPGPPKGRSRPRQRRTQLPVWLLRAMQRMPKELMREEGQLLLGSKSALLDALRGLLSARFTAVELFRSATAESSEYNATVGMDDLDELLLRSNLTLPLEALTGAWHSALQEVGCGHISAEAAPGVRLGYMQFSKAFSKGSDRGAPQDVQSFQTTLPAAPVANASFKVAKRHYRQDRHRRLPPILRSSTSPKDTKPQWNPLGERSLGFMKTLTHLTTGLDEGSVRLALQMVNSRFGAQKISEVFKDRRLCHDKLATLPVSADVQQVKVLKKLGIVVGVMVIRENGPCVVPCYRKTGLDSL
eukprot:symbB.v1.2.000504.t1/scaffold11.1/size528188/53